MRIETARRSFIVRGWIYAAVAASLVAACSGGAPESGTPSPAVSPASTTTPAGTCGRQGRTGTSECGTVTDHTTCSAGTYCSKDSSNIASCFTGCTSDENCGANEHCVSCTGGTVGHCVSCGTPQAQACPDAGSAPDEDASSPGCTRNTQEDIQCMGQSLPARAYDCPSTTEPPASQGCMETLGGAIWCCSN